MILSSTFLSVTPSPNFSEIDKNIKKKKKARNLSLVQLSSLSSSHSIE